MSDPISVTIALSGGGEEAKLFSPATVASYDPRISGDYTPNAPDPPDGLTLFGVPETKIEDVEGASGGFTFSATSRPTGLEAQVSRLLWRGTTWTVLKVRHRTWMGQTNGFTLYLGT